MDFKKRVIEELGMTGHASSHLWDGYVDICEKLAKEYCNEQLGCELVSSSLDLNELEHKLNEALGKETVETLTEWIRRQR